jgi:putative addiction module component (TIGR02574 family)
MPRDAAEILKDTLALPLEARAALIGPLVDSLDTEVDEDAEDAWREEIRRRLQEIESGATKLVPGAASPFGSTAIVPDAGVKLHPSSFFAKVRRRSRSLL